VPPGDAPAAPMPRSMPGRIRTATSRCSRCPSTRCRGSTSCSCRGRPRACSRSSSASPRRSATLTASFDTLRGGRPDLHIGVVSSDLGTSGSNGTPPAPALGACSGTGKAGALVSTAAKHRRVHQRRARHRQLHRRPGRRPRRDAFARRGRLRFSAAAGGDGDRARDAGLRPRERQPRRRAGRRRRRLFGEGSGAVRARRRDPRAADALSLLRAGA